jgi:hypothetical protein
MTNTAELSVTLTAELFERLRAESRRLEVPLEWLVASLVVDTIEGAAAGPVAA